MNIKAPVVVLIILFLAGNDGMAQQLKAGQVLPEVSQEQKTDRLRANFNAFLSVFIAYGKQQGDSPASIGQWAGRQFAKSWGEGLTPRGFVMGMNANWRTFNIETEILEVTENNIKATRDMIMSQKEFQDRYGQYGVTLDDFQAFNRAAMKAITSSFGLTYEEQVEGESIVFTVSESSE